MQKLKINCLTKDYLCLQASVFAGNTGLAWQARQQFMHAPGITSFEVSPFTGKVFIGLDRHIFMQGGANTEAMALMQDYFPALVASQGFQRVYRTLH
jgi:hypothetical protein